MSDLTRRSILAGLPAVATAANAPAAAAATSTGPVNVRDYGAKGDGTADDTAAIRAAQTASDLLYFPVGVYRCSATLTAPTLLGDGPHLSILKYTGIGSAVSVIDPAVRSYHKRITDLGIVTPTAGDVRLDGVPGAGRPVASTVGINLASHSRAHISNVLVAGFGMGAWIYGPELNAYNTFIDVVAGACGRGFVVDAYNANENRFSMCRANACIGWGWDINRGDGNTVVQCAIESSANGVRIRGVDADHNEVAFTRFENNAGYAIRITAEVPYPRLIGNRIWSSGGKMLIDSPTAVRIG